MLKPPGQLRDEVWTALLRARAAAYPLPPFGHHPNFRGARAASARLLEALLQRGWLTAGERVLAYPDYVLKPLRQAALQAGVDVVVPAKHPGGWRLLAASRVTPTTAATIAGAERWGERLSAPPPCRLAFVACVALDARGYVLGKGYGFALKLKRAPLAVSIVHPLQVLEAVPATTLRLGLYATPDGLYEPGVS